jgi:hypothetical protein
MYVEAELSQVLDEGALAYVTVIENHERTYDAATGPKNNPQVHIHGPAQTAYHEWKAKRWTTRQEFIEPMFIVGNWCGYYDGTIWSGRIYPAGPFPTHPQWARKRGWQNTQQQRGWRIFTFHLNEEE